MPDASASVPSGNVASGAPAGQRAEPAPVPPPAPPRWPPWAFPLLRIIFVVAAGFAAWYVAGHWNRWIGTARYESTDDAFMAGDVTPLSAKVSGYVAAVPVADFQTVHKGDLIVEIDPIRLSRPACPGRGQCRRGAARRWPTWRTRRTCSAR